MKPRLVDPKLLVVKKTPKPKKAKLNYSLKFPEFQLSDLSVKWILLIIFVGFIGFYLWDYVQNNDPQENPELDFLPETIKNNHFFGKYTNKKEIEESIQQLQTFNDDQLLLKYNHI